MDRSVFDRVTRLLANPARRRAALAAAATGGLTALSAGTVSAQRGTRACPARCPRGPRGPKGPMGPPGPFGTITKREVGLGQVPAGGVATASPQCQAGETAVSAGFACGNRRAYATLLSVNGSGAGAQIDIFNPGPDPAVCTGSVLCAS